MTDYTEFVGRTERRTVTPDGAEIAAFARAALDGHPAHGAPAFAAPPTYAFALAMVGGGFPFPTDGLIHAEQGFTFARPILASEPLALERTLTRARRRGEGDQAVWILTWEVRAARSDGAEVFAASSRLLARPATGAARAGSEAAASEATAPASEGAAAPLAERAFVLDRAAIAAYADAAGDHNPIHLDDAAARAYGLSGVVAHGMLSMALVAQLAEEWADPAALSALSCKFVAPVALGERVLARTREEGPELVLSLVGADGSERLRGRAARSPR